MKVALIDSGFWFAFYDSTDQYHLQAKELAEYLNNTKILFPWPCLYETLKTKFVKKSMLGFQREIKKANFERVDDVPYRDIALEKLLDDNSIDRKRNLSLVDIVLREMLADISFKINFFITFNAKDFADICSKRRIEIVPNGNFAY